MFFIILLDSTAKNTLKMSVEEKLEYFQQMQVCEDMVLADCFIHVYDTELNPMALDLINATGSMMTDSIIPFLTTHIVVQKFTPVLKQTLNLLHSKAMEGAKSN